MNVRTFLLSALGIFLLVGCSGKEKDSRPSTYIQGQITVDEELDRSGDYSGIELLVSFQDPTGELRDTVFYAVTDSLGFYSGTAIYDERDIFPVVISRNRNTFGVQNMVFADDDTITFNAQLPNVSATASITSRENDVYGILERVERGFSRVAQFINAGAVSSDSIAIELQIWSDLYWEVFEDYPETYASMQAGNASVALASGWNDSLMLDRAEKLLEIEGYLQTTSRSALIDYYAENGGLSEVLTFLDRLERNAVSENNKMNIQIDRIELLYDSSMTREANEQLSRFRETFSNNSSAMNWADNIGYDLEFLTPGSSFPGFSFETLDGRSISDESMIGKPFLIEITRLENPLYQQQFDRTVAIHQIYSNFGLEIITVPIAANEVALRAFYEERGMMWDVANPASFEAGDLIEILNVNQVPTRFLVNDKGEIIRRYIGNEYDEIVRGLQQIITQNN
jgi:hypothetical protein